MGLPHLSTPPRGPASTNIDDLVVAVRGAEVESLAAAGRDDVAGRALAHRIAEDKDAIDALRRQSAATQLATEQARRRAMTDAAAEAIAAERAHAERLLEIAARERGEAEGRALAEARRREAAEAELARAAAARAQREALAADTARERLASEQRAIELARNRIRDEQIAEATALARLAAVRDADLAARQRAVESCRAEEASRKRSETEFELQTVRAAGLAHDEQMSPDPAWRRRPIGSTPVDVPRARRKARLAPKMLATGVAVAIGLVAGTLGALHLLGEPGASAALAQAGARELRLETTLRARR